MKENINKIIQGHCAAVMHDFPDESIDLTVTSPPYDQLRDYKGYDFDFEAIAAQLYRVTKKGGVVVWVVGDQVVDGSESGTSFRQALYFKEIGFNLHDTMIYSTDGMPQNQARYEQEFEYMFVFSNGKPMKYNPIMIKKLWIDKRKIKQTHRKKDGTFGLGTPKKSKNKVKGNIWKYNSGGGHSTKDKIAFGHPAIFPEKLARDHIISWSNPGDIVLDPMCGSGTTPKMAKELGRSYIGIDISEEYCELARKRVAGANVPLPGL